MKNSPKENISHFLCGAHLPLRVTEIPENLREPGLTDDYQDGLWFDLIQALNNEVKQPGTPELGMPVTNKDIQLSSRPIP